MDKQNLEIMAEELRCHGYAVVPPLQETCEEFSLLRECRVALEQLLKEKPLLAAKRCGSTTLGNLKTALLKYKESAEKEN
jgi:hypothetical protein